MHFGTTSGACLLLIDAENKGAREAMQGKILVGWEGRGGEGRGEGQESKDEMLTGTIAGKQALHMQRLY